MENRGNEIREREVARIRVKRELPVMLDKGAYIPVRAHYWDAGMDIRSPINATVPAGGSVVIDSGVHVAIPHGFGALLVSKSGLNVKHNITSTGLIDSEYTGSIAVKLYNHGKADYEVKRGDKISQLVILPTYAFESEIVDTFTPTERGDGGFGTVGPPASAGTDAGGRAGAVSSGAVACARWAPPPGGGRAGAGPAGKSGREP